VIKYNQKLSEFIGMELDSELKQLYIERVEIYNEASNINRRAVIISSIMIAMVAIHVIRNIVVGEISFNILKLLPTSLSINALFLLVSVISRKTKIKAGMRELEEIFELHGLVLKDEVAKGRSIK